jgi:peptidoglycan/LPS O-acetylase OafA/YrhL
MKKIHNLQCLRGAAALSVVLFHISISVATLAHRTTYLTTLFGNGWAGVDLFFVISGCVMAMVTHGHFGSVAGSLKFLYDRVARIIPLYWTISVIVLVVFIVSPGVFHNIGHPSILKSFLLLPEYHQVPLVVQAWTLIYEMYFYYLFAALLLCPEKYTSFCLCVWAAGVVLLNLWVPLAQTPVLSTLTNLICLEFVLGTFVGKIIVQGIRRYARTAMLLGGAIIVGFATCTPRSYGIPSLGRLLEFGGPSALLTYGVVASGDRLKLPRWLGRLGDCSYSLYLVHYLAIGAIAFVWKHVLPAHAVLAGPVMLAAAVGSGEVGYRAVERPFMQLAKRVKRQLFGEPGPQPQEQGSACPGRCLDRVPVADAPFGCSIASAPRSPWQSSLKSESGRQSLAATLSVVVIAKNEEKTIGRCLESVQVAARRIGGAEILLVDSASSDRTIPIARSLGVRVVSLRPEWEFSPSAGRYVGFHKTSGEFVMFVDADTEISPDWLASSLSYFETANVGGVAGHLTDIDVDGHILPAVHSRCLAARAVRTFRGIAMYRREAMDIAGTFNPYLAAEEEAELAGRLRKKGWRLMQVPCPMGVHLRGTSAVSSIVRLLRQGRYVPMGRALRYAFHAGTVFELLAARFIPHMAFLLGMSLWCSAILLSGTGMVARAAWAVVFAGAAAIACKKRTLLGPCTYVLQHLLTSYGVIAGMITTSVHDPRAYPLDCIEQSEDGRWFGPVAAETSLGVGN